MQLSIAICFAWCVVATISVAATTRLDNTVLPEVIKEAKTTFHFTKGQTAKLVCPFKRNPSVFYDWKKIYPTQDDFVAIYDSRFDGREDNGRVLRIKRVNFPDGGTFRCIAITGYGAEAADIHLFVKDKNGRLRLNTDGIKAEKIVLKSEQVQAEPPTITKISPSDKNVMQPAGSTVQLRCDAQGVPVPEITWEKNGQQIKSEELDVSGSKYVKFKTSGEDTGQYTCIAKNQFGIVQHSFPVEIVERQPPKPKISQLLPDEREVREGTLVTLQCKVEIGLYDGTIQVNWLKLVENADLLSPDHLRFEDKEYLMVHGSDSSEVGDGQYLSKLPLGRVTPDQSGTYVCFAVSSPGYDKKEVELLVRPIRKGTSVTTVIVLSVMGTLAALCILTFAVCFIVRTRSRPNHFAGHQQNQDTKHSVYRRQTNGEDEEAIRKSLSDDGRTECRNSYVYLAPPSLVQTNWIKDSPDAPPPSAATSRSCLTSHCSLRYDLPVENYYDPPSGYRQPNNSSVSSLPSSINTLTNSFETELEIETVQRNGRTVKIKKSRHFYV